MSHRVTASWPGRPRGPGTSWIRAHALEVALALPLVVYVLVLTAAPIVETMRLSVSAPLDGGFPSLGRYRALLASDLFHAALRNTVVVVLLSLVLEISLGLVLALTLHRRFPLRGLVRTLVLMPLGVPTVVSAAVMLLVFTRAGYLNALLFAVADALGAIGIEWRFEPIGWTVAGGLPTLFTVAVADTWKVVPVVTLILLAGLQAIPEVGGDVLGIPRGITGRRREHAVQLATFLMSREAQERLVAGNAWPAIRGDAYGQVPVAQRETFEAVRRALAGGWHRPGAPYWSDVSDAMNEAVRRILQGGEPVRPVLDGVHTAIAAAARRKGAPYPPSR